MTRRMRQTAFEIYVYGRGLQSVAKKLEKAIGFRHVAGGKDTITSEENLEWNVSVEVGSGEVADVVAAVLSLDLTQVSRVEVCPPSGAGILDAIQEEGAYVLRRIAVVRTRTRKTNRKVSANRKVSEYKGKGKSGRT